MANIYEKLTKMRLALSEKGVKGSGKNNYSNYNYISLEDILPKIIKLLDENKVSSCTTFTKDLATLTLIDCEKPDATIVFTSPMSTAKLKACHEVQNLGAVQTYLRRYLWMTAFEIAETDPVDTSAGPDKMLTAPVQQNTAPQNSANQAPAVNTAYLVNMQADNLHDEIVKLWHYAGWNLNDLPGYEANWGKQKGITKFEKTHYQALLKELIAYLKSIGFNVEEELPF